VAALLFVLITIVAIRPPEPPPDRPRPRAQYTLASILIAVALFALFFAFARVRWGTPAPVARARINRPLRLVIDKTESYRIEADELRRRAISEAKRAEDEREAREMPLPEHGAPRR
jgi:hypothetical protein